MMFFITVMEAIKIAFSVMNKIFVLHIFVLGFLRYSGVKNVITSMNTAINAMNTLHFFIITNYLSINQIQNVTILFTTLKSAHTSFLLMGNEG